MKVFTSKTQQLGEMGENQAVSFLVKNGYSIVERNVNNRYGEIDIVAKKKGTVYFFEVKAGKASSWFNPAENLTKVKLRKFLISVEHYVLMHRISDYKAQGIIVLFDVESEVGFEVLNIS